MIDQIALTGPTGPATRDESALREVARDLEVTFLTEMLASAGLGEVPEAFGGGIGEEQFASLLREEQARQLVAGGGIGLAESIFSALVARQNG